MIRYHFTSDWYQCCINIDATLHVLTGFHIPAPTLFHLQTDLTFQKCPRACERLYPVQRYRDWNILLISLQNKDWHLFVIGIDTNLREITQTWDIFASPLIYSMENVCSNRKKKVFLFFFFCLIAVLVFELPLENDVKIFQVNPVTLTPCSLKTPKRVTGKQCRPRSDAAERGVWSGSTLFASG